MPFDVLSTERALLHDEFCEFVSIAHLTVWSYNMYNGNHTLDL